jgi:hypothetical protein
VIPHAGREPIAVTVARELGAVAIMLAALREAGFDAKLPFSL